MKIICVTNRLLCTNNFLEQIEKICATSPNAIILREKDLDDESYEKLFIECNKTCKKYNVSLYINSKINIATKLNCKNIQLSFNDFLNHPDKLNLFNNIAVSIHSLTEALVVGKFVEETKQNVFIIAGHIFETHCKKDLKPRGVEFLKEICNNVDIPVFAIGGINENTIKQLKNINIAGICLMSALMKNLPKTVFMNLPLPLK